MFRSAGLRFIAVGALALLMFIPLKLVSGIIQERAHYAETTEREISREWGGDQLISGPLLIVPVTEDVTYERKREAVDPVTGRTIRDAKNFIVYERYDETVTEDRAPLFLYPDRFDATVATESQVRQRGIFTVPVFTAHLDLAFDFDTEGAEALLSVKEKAQWSDAELQVYLGSNRALRGEATLISDGTPFSLEPIASGSKTGVTAKVGDPRALKDFSLVLGMNGAQRFGLAATGRTTRVAMTSDWPDPSFGGSFLPNSSEVSHEGFSANWIVPHLARSLPQTSRENLDSIARESATMEVRFITPNDFYQKAWRSARYGILFIALTFLTILLLERASARPAHPVQYLMVGLAQSVFVLLMVAYAEQIGFEPAYAVASGATIGLLTLFGAVSLKLGRQTWLLGGVLVAVYGVLFLILRSADYALLAGSTLTFVALALTMWLTRNEDWHGPQRDGGFRLFRPRNGAPSSPEIQA